jgi:hypothetical protein
MRRTYPACTVIAGFMLLVTACSPDQAAGGESGRPGEEAELAHAQCMRDHGLDWPDPEFVDGEWELPRLDEDIDLESPDYRSAETECAQVRQQAQPEGGDDLSPDDRARLEGEMDRMLEFAACMRDQGLEFPDPVMDDDGTISGAAGPMDGDWEAFEAAKAVCEDQTGAPMP